MRSSQRACPCCGQPINEAGLPEELDRACTGWASRKILLLLWQRPKGVMAEAMVAYLYADDPRGGPLDPHKTLDVLVSRLRKRLREMGLPWTISYRTRGPNLSPTPFQLVSTAKAAEAQS